MTTKELVSIAEETTRLLNEDNASVQYLNRLDLYHDKISALLIEHESSYSEQVKENTKLKISALTSEIAITVVSISLRTFDAEFSNIKNALDVFSIAVPTTPNPEVSLYDNFIESVDSYWRVRGDSNLMLVIVAAARLTASIDTLRSIAGSLTKSFNAPAFENYQGDSLSIFLYSKLTYAEFADKLRVVQSLYEECAELLNVSLAQNPLRIAKIESGSTWLDILGSAAVIALMKDIIISGASYLYRNHSKEGQKVQIPKDVETIKSILNAKKALIDLGVTGVEVEQEKKSMIALSNKLNALLDNESAIEINGTTHPLSEAAQQRLLTGKKMLTLRDGNSPEDPY